MLRIAIFCLVGLAHICNAQVNEVKIHLKDGKEVLTEKVKIVVQPFHRYSYVKTLDRQKISFKKIDSIGGMSIDNKRYQFLFFDHNRVEFSGTIHAFEYHQGLTFFSYQKFNQPKHGKVYRERMNYYQIGNEPPLELKYNNVKYEVAKTNNDLVKFRNLSVLQRLSQLAGLVLFTNYIVKNHSYLSSEFFTQTNNHTFHISAGLIVLPLLLNQSKTKKLKNALLSKVN